jgi:radical SAM protein with 4Fe4S-binding SPASM domain
MSTGRVLSVIDEITDAGCLNLLISGGEPLLRKDFPEIYRHAKERGLLVTVFSNGTLVTEDLLELFRDLPPLEVEISLYGATAHTYESVTCVPGSYERCLLGIRRLVSNNIKVKLKTILMSVNIHELFAIENIAREFGVKFRFDAAISPCLGGDRAPMELRVAPEKAVEMEFSDGVRSRRWKEFFEESREFLTGDGLYGCGAGVTSFHIDPGGCLRPCMMTRDVQYDLPGSGFLRGWGEIGARLREKKARADFACRDCEKINLCGYCPAFFSLENGTEDARSAYLCKMGELRYQRIRQHC